MVKIEFTKDFANRKKGDVMEINTAISSRMINVLKVAKYFEERKKKQKNEE